MPQPSSFCGKIQFDKDLQKESLCFLERDNNPAGEFKMVSDLFDCRTDAET